MKDIVNLKLPCKAEFVNVARMNVATIANNMKMNYEVIQDLKVAVSEACNNVILHSDSDGYYEVVFAVTKNKLIIDINDYGVGFDMKNYKKPDLEHPKGHGLGLFIIENLVDEMKIITEDEIGTTIKMIKNV